MRVIIFGATGMVGQGVLRECLLAEDVKHVLIIGRTAPDQTHQKLQSLILADLLDYTDVATELQNFDACFFCLGVSSSGVTESDYVKITYEVTLAAAQTLCRINSGMTFVYVSGAGTDSTEMGNSMWARVKGRTENSLKALPFKGVYLFRPGVIVPMHGIRSKTTSYRILYSLMSPLLPFLRWLLPSVVLTTEVIGRAMLEVARNGAPKTILESSDINNIQKT